MASHIVFPNGDKTTIVKCKNCKAMYVPDSQIPISEGYHEGYFEKCPICGYDRNDWDNTISLWKYNLIKWIRGVKK